MGNLVWELSGWGGVTSALLPLQGARARAEGAAEGSAGGRRQSSKSHRSPDSSRQGACLSPTSRFMPHCCHTSAMIAQPQMQDITLLTGNAQRAVQKKAGDDKEREILKQQLKADREERKDRYTYA